MKLKKVKNCFGCKGYLNSSGSAKCACGFPLKLLGRTKTFLGDLLEHAPESGVCCKPRTIKELEEFKKNNTTKRKGKK